MIRRVALLLLLAAGAPVPDPTGRWLTERGDGVVEITRCGAALCGRLVGGRIGPGASDIGRDVHGARLCGLTLFSDMHLDEEAGRDVGSSWSGHVYNPLDGRVYTARLTMPGPDQVRLRGYIGLPLFGASELWTRFTGALDAECQMR